MSDNVYHVKQPTIGKFENPNEDTEEKDERQVRVLTPYLTYLIEGVEYAAAAGMYGSDHVFIIFREHQKESMVFPAGLAEHLLTECVLRGGE